MRFGILLLLLLACACVKEEGNVAPASASGGTTGTTSGGTTGGSSGGSTGDDPLASEAWHLENTGQSSFSLSNGVAGEDINLTSVHTTLDILGRGVRIAVSDSGANLTHADLSANTLTGEHRNYTFSDSTRWTSQTQIPTSYHGTGVSGLIAAVGWNGIGSRGVAPSSNFASFLYVYDDNSSAASRLAKEIDQMDGDFDIFNYSYGYAGFVFVNSDDLVFDALEAGATNLRNGKGANYIQAAGNSYQESYDLDGCDETTWGVGNCTLLAAGNTNAHSGLATPYKIVVAAVNASGVSSSYSTPGSSVWISAPGGEFGTSSPAMITTDLPGCLLGASIKNFNLKDFFNYGYHPLNLACDYSNLFNGTSSATPVTSGVVALMLEANPNLTWREVKYILAVTAEVIDDDPIFNTLTHPNGFDLPGYTYDLKWTPNHATVPVYFSNWYGFGRVNAFAAVNMASSWVSGSLNTLEKTQDNTGTLYYDSGTINLPIPDVDSTGVDHEMWVGHNYVIESVQVHLTTDHTWPGDLAVHLISPSGTESRLMTINNNIYSMALDANTVMATNAFLNEESQGYWTIRIYDGSSDITSKYDGTITGTGNLNRWKIQIIGHQKTADLVNPYPVNFLTMASTFASSSATPSFSFSHTVSIADLLYYEASVGTTPGATDVQNWTNIGTADVGHQLTGIAPALTDLGTYYLNVRAVDVDGDVSSIQVKPWQADY